MSIENRNRRRLRLAGLTVLFVAANVIAVSSLAADTDKRSKPVKVTVETVATSFGDIAVMISEGRGPNVLLIHGNSSAKEIFQKQLTSPLGRRYRMVAMDLPGHGGSRNAADPAKTYNIPGYAMAAGEVMDKLKMTSATVIGWSLGGHIGIDMLSRNAKVRGLLITGTPPIGKNPEALGQGFKPTPHMGLTGKEVFTAEDADAYAHATAGRKAPFEPFIVDSVRRTDGRARRMMIEAFMRGVGDDQRKIVETSKVPLAVVAGGEDEFVNNDYLKLPAYGNLWRGQVQLIPAVGHAPFWEAPDQFNILLGAFLADVNGKARAAN